MDKTVAEKLHYEKKRIESNEFIDKPATNQGRPKIEQMTMMIAKTRRSKW